jgi:Flp pilus assembly protein TadD
LVGTLDETCKKATKTAEIEAAIKEGNFQNATAALQELLDTAEAGLRSPSRRGGKETAGGAGSDCQP